MTHHAYLAQPTTVSKAVVDCFYDVSNYQDISYIEVTSFGIDDVRSLTTTAYSTPTAGTKKLMVVIARDITVEAEQALLKILEEPPQTTVFLFVLPNSVYLLPTLLSRFFKLTLIKPEVGGEDVLSDFLKMDVATRIATIAKRIDSKDQDWVSGIKSGLLNYLDENSKNLASSGKLEPLMFVADFLMTRGASNKQLLEELALTLE
jgi:DNA polymerase III delta prime subunit